MKSRFASTPHASGSAAAHLPPRSMKPLPTMEEDLRVGHQAIAEAAYLRAERRGFAPGGEMGDWLTAEAGLMERA